MPQLKFSHVVSFSSEDPQNPASNLLANEISRKKWLGEKGESSLSVVLQLEKSSLITSVHVGSYHSALVEILAGRSEAPNQPFKVLVATSIFINPSDSRKNDPVEVVRTFSVDQLLAETRNENWDRLRVVCSQPYNKHCQFGLSFLHIFGSEKDTNSEKSNTEQNSVSLGRFKLRPPSSDEEDFGGPSHFKPGELFSKLKQGNQLSIDAQIRQASSTANLKKISKEDSPSFFVKANIQSKMGPQITQKDLNIADSKIKSRNDILYNAEDSAPNKKIDHLFEKDRELKAKLNVNEENEKKPQERKGKKEAVMTSDIQNDQRKKDISSIFSKYKDNKNSPKNKNEHKKNDSSNNQDRKRQHSNNDESTNSAKKKPRATEVSASVPYCNIMNGVVFVFSGYVNPQRSNLRDKAIAMGAKYRQDWTQDSTHLICAFPNTPKLKQVKKMSNQNVAIVTAKWIEECDAKKKLLPWEYFATEPHKRLKRELSPSLVFPMDEDNSSDGDTDDDIEKVMKEQMKKYSENQKKKQENIDKDPPHNEEKEKNVAEKQNIPKTVESEDSAFSDATNADEEEMNKSLKSKDYNSFQKESLEITFTNEESKNSTNVEGSENVNGDNSLPDFFSDMNFYIDPEVENEGFSCDLLSRYIIAYNGNMVKTLKPKTEANFILSFRDKVFKIVDDNVRIVKPNWIWDCNDSKRKVSFSKYLVPTNVSFQ